MELGWERSQSEGDGLGWEFEISVSYWEGS